MEHFRGLDRNLVDYSQGYKNDRLLKQFLVDKLLSAYGAYVSAYILLDRGRSASRLGGGLLLTLCNINE